MPEGIVMWSCPRCGEQNSSDVAVCSRCGGAPGVFPVPAHRCPACGVEVNEVTHEGKLRCPQCRNEFEDYEEWVRRCRAAAWAAIRPTPPVPEPPPPKPAHLSLIAGGLLAAAVFYAAAGFLVDADGLLVPCLALALFQAVAAVSLLTGQKHADAAVRFAAAASALIPLFVLPAVFFVGLFAFFSRPLVSKYFGGRTDPAPDRLRHPLLAWLGVLTALVAALFATIVAGALETARRWNDALPPLLEFGARVSAFFAANVWWAPAGVAAGLCTLAIWGKVNRTGFLVLTILLILGVASAGAPPVVAAWMYEKGAQEASGYLEERDVQRLLWGVREPDPKIRSASLRAMESAGFNARVALPAILRSLQDPDRTVRFSAACALAQFDPAAAGVIELLLAVLEDPAFSEEERDRAAVAIGYYGPRARPALTRLLERLRRGDAATLALAEMGPASIPGLTQALGDADPKVRRRAARALKWLGPAARSAVPPLSERLKDPDPGVRGEAALALGEIHREKAVPLLRAMIREDRAAAKPAAEALCALGQRDALAELPEGSSSLNALRQPAIWDHLGRAVLEKDVEGSGTEILVELAERAVMCADVAPEARQPALGSFRRISAAARRRSVLEVLTSLDVDFVLESDRIRILSPEQARAFWMEWLAETRKKKE